jgi:hypothetical protein
MSSWGAVTPEEEQPVRRVRDVVKDGVAASACSLGASALVAIAITVVSKLAG